MSDDQEENELGHIPAFIRTMLDPFVNIMNPRTVKPARRRLEPTFLIDIFRPTEEQLTAIGRVCAAWSVLEHIIGIAIARLALAPEFPTLALTKELTANNRIRVLRAIIPLHAERFRLQIANRALVDELLTIPAKLQVLKDKRNAIIHTVWTKKNVETVSAMRSKPVTASKATAEPRVEMTVSQINLIAQEIQEMADHLFLLTQMLPAVDEGPHAQSLAQAVPLLHDEILPARPRPPESLPEKD